MVDFHEKLDKGVFVIFSKWLSILMPTEEALEKLVQEVGERIGGFRNKEKEIENRAPVSIINFLNTKKLIQNTITETNSPAARLNNFCFICFFNTLYSVLYKFNLYLIYYHEIPMEL